MVLTMKTPLSKDARKGSFPSAKDMCGSEAEDASPVPGRFLSRSEDNLDGVGPPGSGGARNGSNPAVSPAATTQSRPNSHLFSATTPLKESANVLPHGSRSSPTERAISKRRAASQQADARISKTKLTVTELQKAKLGLEGQLSELTRKAEARQAEIAALKMELRKAREEAREAAALRQSNEGLRQRLGGVEDARKDAATATSTAPDSSSITVTPASAPDTPLASDMPGPETDALAVPSSADWDKQSQTSEVSVACLQDRIVQMEESHYSTSEELQATLQELTDLQDIVNDLSKESALVAEERAQLAQQVEKQASRLDQAKLQIQHLKHLLLSGLQARHPHHGGPSGDGDAEANDGEDREQQLLQVLKATHEEHEDLKGRYLELRKSYQAAVEEARERSEMSEMGRDRTRLLEHQLASVEEERASLSAQLLTAEQRREADRRELARLSSQVESGRARLEELQRQVAAGSATEVEAILESGRKEKAEAESELATLRFQLAEVQTKLSKSEAALRELKEELYSTDSLNKDLEQRLTDFHKEKIYDRNLITDTEKARAELEERCRRLADDKAELKASVLTLQHHIDEISAERDALRTQLDELRSAKATEEAEWRQFQADLQTAVVVANDLKLEAQTEIERLSEENSSLRLKLASQKEEVERLRLRTKVGRAPVSTPTTASSLSVKSLIESLEKPRRESEGNESKAAKVPMRVPSPSPGPKLPLRHSVPESGGLSKSSTNLSGTGTGASPPRPTSVALPPSSDSASLKGATSETELRRASVLAIQVGKGGGSGDVAAANATPRPVPPPPIPESVTTSPRPKGILLKTPPPSSTATTSLKAYLDPEKKDPLAKLMKDAPRGSRRNALLKWSQSRTLGYNNVEVTNFSSSWNDGLAFCALLHSYLPTKIPYAELDAKNKRRNFELAFGVGSELGIPCELSASEMASLERPDWARIMEYVTQIYKRFNPDTAP